MQVAAVWAQWGCITCVPCGVCSSSIRDPHPRSAPCPVVRVTRSVLQRIALGHLHRPPGTRPAAVTGRPLLGTQLPALFVGICGTGFGKLVGVGCGVWGVQGFAARVGEEFDCPWLRWVFL